MEKPCPLFGTWFNNDLAAGQLKVRRICKEQSVIVFRLVIAGASHADAHREREEREAPEAARKLLPLLRKKLHKQDALSINGPILTAVVCAGQYGAEQVAHLFKQAVESTALRLGPLRREGRLTVVYGSLTFP